MRSLFASLRCASDRVFCTLVSDVDVVTLSQTWVKTQEIERPMWRSRVLFGFRLVDCDMKDRLDLVRSFFCKPTEFKALADTKSLR